MCRCLQGGRGCNLPTVTIINVKLLQRYVCEGTAPDNKLRAAQAVCVASTRLREVKSTSVKDCKKRS